MQVNNGAHTVFVIAVNNTQIQVVEGNYNNRIHWGRWINKSSISTYNGSKVVWRAPNHEAKIRELMSLVPPHHHNRRLVRIIFHPRQEAVMMI